VRKQRTFIGPLFCFSGSRSSSIATAFRHRRQRTDMGADPVHGKVTDLLFVCHESLAESAPQHNLWLKNNNPS
jgi:hypothetical protein